MENDHPSAQAYAKQIEANIHGAENAWSRPDHHQQLRLNAAEAVVKLRDEVHDLTLDPDYAQKVGLQLLKDGVSASEVSNFLPGAKVEKDETGHEHIVFSPVDATSGKTTDERIENASTRRSASPAEQFLEKLETWMPGDLHTQQLAWKHLLHGWVGTPDITKAENDEVHKHIPKS
jgi:hypothetical protein